MIIGAMPSFRGQPAIGQPQTAAPTKRVVDCRRQGIGWVQRLPTPWQPVLSGWGTDHRHSVLVSVASPLHTGPQLGESLLAHDQPGGCQLMPLIAHKGVHGHWCCRAKQLCERRALVASQHYCPHWAAGTAHASGKFDQNSSCIAVHTWQHVQADALGLRCQPEAAGKVAHGVRPPCTAEDPLG